MDINHNCGPEGAIISSSEFISDPNPKDLMGVGGLRKF